MANLSEFLEESKKRIQTILDQLHWTADDVVTDFKSLTSKQAEAIRDEEPLFPSSCTTENSVVLENSDLSELLQKSTMIPQKFSDLQVNFSREEKLLLYEHVKSQIDKTKIPYLDESKDLVSIADIVAMKKHEKKNRRKHRVSKPTRTEELRSLVELQMQSLEQHLKQKHASQIFIERDKSTGKQGYHSQSPQKRKEKYVTTQSNEESKTPYNYEQRNRSNYRHNYYNEKAETSCQLHTKNTSRSRSKEYRRSRSKERTRTSSHKQRRSRSHERNRTRNYERRRSRSKEKSRRSSPYYNKSTNFNTKKIQNELNRVEHRSFRSRSRSISRRDSKKATKSRKSREKHNRNLSRSRNENKSSSFYE